MENQSMSSRGAIGGRLSDARFQAGMSIADLAACTKISSRYLEAIEREDFACLPSRCHTLGFARAFARAVKADEGEVLGALRERFEEDTPAPASASLRETASQSLLASLAVAVQSWSAFVFGGFNQLTGRTAR